MSLWDDPEIQADEVSFIKLEKVGDSCEGIIAKIERQTFTDEDGDKKVVPKLTLRYADGTDHTLTAGQVQLRRKLVEARPDVGDYLKVTLTQIQPLGGGRKLKHIDVVHKPGNGSVPAPAPSAAASATASERPPF